LNLVLVEDKLNANFLQKICHLLWVNKWRRRWWWCI